MRRIVLWALSTLSVVVLLFGYSTSTSGPASTAPQTAFVSESTAGTSTPSQTTGSSNNSTGSGSRSAPTPRSGTKSPTAPKTVRGDTAQTRWGPVQVELELSGSTISKVSVVQYPDGNGRDQEINSYALPVLIQETMDAQSAKIDMVSGATYTSDGYLESLQSALDQADA